MRIWREYVWSWCQPRLSLSGPIPPDHTHLQREHEREGKTSHVLTHISILHTCLSYLAQWCFGIIFIFQFYTIRLGTFYIPLYSTYLDCTDPKMRLHEQECGLLGIYFDVSLILSHSETLPQNHLRIKTTLSTRPPWAVPIDCQRQSEFI